MAGTSLRDLLPEILSLILEELPDLYSLFSAARSLSRPDVWGDLPRISRQIFRCTCLDAKMDERASLPKVFWGLLSATECRELDGNALRRLFDEGWKVSIGLGLEEALIPIGMVLARRLSSEEAIGFLIGLCVLEAEYIASWSVAVESGGGIRLYGGPGGGDYDTLQSSGMLRLDSAACEMVIKVGRTSRRGLHKLILSKLDAFVQRREQAGPQLTEVDVEELFPRETASSTLAECQRVLLQRLRYRDKKRKRLSS
ncbi:hypothetical protein A7C99_3778 [Trichophyton rubrum]|uniref:Uncharacterized protein n=1 Tax=Trichophyton rubrum TaxID=5551 RepID=A0A178EZD2_TRIRU|nr:hypothetical protein A7C99_3778 [Trichophyton rubrum]